MVEDIKKLLEFGIINIDKPTGPTSFSISDYIRKTLGLKKTSHFGTLDPLVTGVLPVALGRACKLTGDFLGHDKVYVGIMHTHQPQDMQALQKLIDDNFSGKIMQLPPKKSRVKREVREREIMRFELIEQSEDKKDFLFISEVQGGTYIRKLCSDLGEMIGGAHMAELRRTRAGIFLEADPKYPSVRLYDFDEAVKEYKAGKPKKLQAMIIPAAEAIKEIYKVVQGRESSVFHFLTGKPLFRKDFVNPNDIPSTEKFALFVHDRFIEIAHPVREGDIVARPDFVFS